MYNIGIKSLVILLRQQTLSPQFKSLIITSFLNVNLFKAREMSQKSITSFFKITPKKPVDNVSPAEITNSHSPISNRQQQKSSKRQRLESSENEESPQEPFETSPVNIAKKKKKRQRIESSESESPVISPVKAEPEIKLQKNGNPKTYGSPKTIKTKSKLEKTSEEWSSTTSKKEKLANDDSSKTIKARHSPISNKIGKKKEDVDIENVVHNVNIISKKEKLTDDPSTKTNMKKSLSNGKKLMNSPISNEADVLTNWIGVKKEKEEMDSEEVAARDYNPSKSNYHPINDACWSKGEEVPYLALAKTLEAIEATSARLKMIEILSNYFRSVVVLTPEDLLPSIYMCLNQLAPAYHSLELGIAETYLMKAIGQCTGRTLAQVKSAASKCGDLGQVAEQARSTQLTMFAPPPLMARRVFASLKEIAHMTGQASVNKKIGKIQTLYVACKHSEARYLIRSLEGKLRIGLAEQSVLQALALAVATTPPDPDGVKVLNASKGLSAEEFKARVDEHALLIKTTYCECPNYELIVPVLLQHGCAALPQYCRLTPGIPLKPMLAHPTKGVHEVFNRFENEEFTCEWKYDGERAQIHVPARKSIEGQEEGADLANAAIFSRNQENNTSKYPDVLKRLPALFKASVSSCVLDCEAVAYDVATKQILPFQILSTRKRKDAAESEIKVQVCVFVFDLLYLNGKPLVREPLADRRALLREHFNVVEGEWQFATSKDCSTMEEVQQFLEDSVKGSCEGLMVKTLRGDHAKYDIARRSHNWLKLKKDYLDGVGDTIDVVVIGAYRGRGKRSGNFGGFLLACYEPDTEEYQSLCKIGTGFTDEDLQTLSETLKKHVIDRPKNYYRYDSSHSPDVWVEAACVWEVRCADLSLSPAHRAALGLVDPEKGISLRFPRFIRARDDKGPESATTALQIAEMYLAQDQVRNTASTAAKHATDDFY